MTRWAWEWRKASVLCQQWINLLSKLPRAISWTTLSWFSRCIVKLKRASLPSRRRCKVSKWPSTMKKRSKTKLWLTQRCRNSTRPRVNRSSPTSTRDSSLKSSSSILYTLRVIWPRFTNRSRPRQIWNLKLNKELLSWPTWTSMLISWPTKMFSMRIALYSPILSLYWSWIAFSKTTSWWSLWRSWCPSSRNAACSNLCRLQRSRRKLMSLFSSKVLLLHSW